MLGEGAVWGAHLQGHQLWVRIRQGRALSLRYAGRGGGIGGLTCRGINGFGSASVRVELLVSGMLGEGAVWGAHLQRHQRLRVR
jgi:hypothetical protein